jgi:hypothetical protein
MSSRLYILQENHHRLQPYLYIQTGDSPAKAHVRSILDNMFKRPFLCLTLCVALAGEHKPDGANLSPAQQRNVEKLAGDLESIKGKSQVTPHLKASGISSSDATLIASDFKTIRAEIQKTAQGAQPGEIRKTLGRK